MKITSAKVYTNIESTNNISRKRFYRNNLVKLITIAVIFVMYIVRIYSNFADIKTK